MGIEAGRLYYLPVMQADGEVGIGLTGAADERKSCATSQVDESMHVLGGTSNTAGARGTVKGGSGKELWSDGDVGLINVFGYNALAEPYCPYTPAHFLGSGDKLSVSVLNSSAEGSASDPGHLVFVADPVASQKTKLPDDLGRPFFLELNCGLTGATGETKPVSTPTDERPLVVWGASSDMVNTFLEITDAEGQNWMRDPVPVWALCGLKTGQARRLIWSRPYVIPVGRSIRIKVTNAASSPVTDGVITLITSRLPK